ncbi:MAG: outer membrane protein [Pyrinomonadaceae bacterium]
MRTTIKISALAAVCLLTSTFGFSQEAVNPTIEPATVNEVTTTLKTVDPRNKEKEKVQAKRQTETLDDWKGFYIGGNIGGTTSNHSLATSTTFCGGFVGGVSGGVFTNTNGCYFAQSSVDLINIAGNQEVKPKGFTGGVQAGYNFQARKFVAGVEADFNSARQNQTVSGSDIYTNINPGYPLQITQTIKTDWLMTIRPRAGVAVGRALIYGTGGLAVTNVNYQMNFEDFPPNPPVGYIASKGTASNTIKETKAGWTAGAGAEFKINDNWSVKGEYLYTEFKTNGTSNNASFVTINSSGGASGLTSLPNQIFNDYVKLQTHHFKFGVNYRF